MKPVRLVLERHVEETICQFLEWDGWHVLKMEENYSERKRKRTGEPGMPDRLALRYNPDQILWLELKRPGEKPRPDQIVWHEAERSRGALVLVVSDIDDFMKRWYPKSGLQRRPPVVR